MKLVDIHAMPNANGYEEISSFSNYEIDELKANNIKQAYYWYAQGSYEGSGYMLFETQDGKWDVKSLSHCSCYGPLEDLHQSIVNAKYTTAIDVLNDCSGDYKKEVQALIDAAINGGENT